MTNKPLFIDPLFIMDDLPSELKPRKETEPMTVTALSYALKNLVENSFAYVRIRGEISGFKKAASGHMYFALKDEESVLDAVAWRGSASKFAVIPEDGMEVICTGKITTYPGRSKYQIVVETMEMAGQGALLKLLEERRQKLAAEGLFAQERKKEIPFLPDVIGVVTSPTGAVIRDIMHRLNERFPRHVLLWPTVVQGEEAAGQIARAIKGFNAIPKEGLKTPNGLIPRPDVLIIARGGGSLEDLWAFNEEIVVRAAAESEIPLISAVGHETDTTLIDYAADLRAPTPTGAAEKAVPVRLDLLSSLAETMTRMTVSVSRLLGERANILTGLGRGLPPLEQIIAEHTQKLDDRSERFQNALTVYLTQMKARLEQIGTQLSRPDLLLSTAQNELFRLSHPLESLIKACLSDNAARSETAGRLLESFSYERILERGFALVMEKGEKPVSSSTEAAKKSILTLKFTDGNLDVIPQSPLKTKRTRSSKNKNDADKQGTLL